MKTKALSEPKQRKAFRDKYLAAVLAVAALLISSISSAQTDSLKYSQINGYGFKYKRMAFDSVLMIPLSTSPHAPYRMGALRYKAADSTLQLWTGHQWNSILTGVGNGIDTAYAYDDSTLAIETPNRDYFIKIKGKPSATQLNDSAFIVGDDTITIHGTSGGGAPSGPAGGALTGTYPNPSIADDSITQTKLRQSVGLSVMGNIGNTTDYPGDIVAANDGNVLRRFGTSLGFGAINLASSNAVTGILFIGNTDTSSTNHLITQSDLNDTAAVLRAAIGTGGGGSFNAGQGIIKSVSGDTSSIDFVRSKKVVALGMTGMNVFGDSYSQLDPLSYDYKSWVQILASRLGVSLSNYALSGHGLYYAAAQANANVAPGSNTKMTVILDGLNDLRYGGGTTSTLNKIKWGYYATIFNSLIDTCYYGNSTSITQSSGSAWTSASFATLGGKSGNFGTNGVYSKTIGDTLTTTLSGDAIGIGFIGADGSVRTGGTFKVIADNNTVVSSFSTNNLTNAVSDGTNDNSAQPGTLFIKGLGKGPHTIKVVVTSADTVRIDYIANAKPATSVSPVVIGQLPRLNVAGYATPPANANNAVMASGDSVILEVIKDFVDYPVTLAYCNNYWDSTQTRDNIHPDSIAHRSIAKSFMEKIIASPTPSSSIAAPGSSGDVPFNASGTLSATGDLNFDNGSKILKVNGQIAAGAASYASSWLLSANKVGAATVAGMSNDDNNSNSNNFRFIKSKAGSYNLGSGVKIGYSDYNSVLEHGVVTNGTTDGSGFSLGDYYWNVSGSPVARITSGGTFIVGSNTTPLTTEKLRVDGDAVFLANSGNTKFSIGGANAQVSTHSLYLAKTGGNTIASFYNNDNNTNYPGLYFEKTRSGSYNMTLGDIIGDLNFGFFSGIQGVANSTVSGGFRGNDLVFYGADGSLTVAERMRMLGAGNLGIGLSAPTATLHIKAGTATAGTAPLKLTSGTNLTTPEDGAVEYNGTHFYATIGSTRYQLDQQAGSGITSINSQTGPAITIQGGSGVVVNNTTNTVTVSADPTSDIFMRVIDAQYADANNTGTSQTDLYTKTIAGVTLSANGASLEFDAAGTVNDATATVDLQLLFAGNGIGGTGAVSISGIGTFTAKGRIIRTSSSTARVWTAISIPNSSTKYFETTAVLTGLDFTTSNILKITGQAGGGGGGSSDITGQMWHVNYNPAP